MTALLIDHEKRATRALACAIIDEIRDFSAGRIARLALTIDDLGPREEFQREAVRMSRDGEDPTENDNLALLRGRFQH